jgi:phage baseplate assembly protein W
VAASFLGTGWAFPIKPQADGRLAFASGEEKIRQSIWLVLSTSPGERVMRPEFGCGVHDLVFEANTPLLHGLLKTRVRAALTRWEPRIDVLEVEIEAPPERRNYLGIRITYRVRSNNAFFNLVYPFFLNEGASQ